MVDQVVLIPCYKKKTLYILYLVCMHFIDTERQVIWCFRIHDSWWFTQSLLHSSFVIEKVEEVEIYKKSDHCVSENPGIVRKHISIHGA